MQLPANRSRHQQVLHSRMTLATCLPDTNSAPMAILRFTIDTPRACLAIPETTIHPEAFLNTYHLHLHRQSETGQKFSTLQPTNDRKSRTPEAPWPLTDCLRERLQIHLPPSFNTSAHLYCMILFCRDIRQIPVNNQGLINRNFHHQTFNCLHTMIL